MSTIKIWYGQKWELYLEETKGFQFHQFTSIYIYYCIYLMYVAEYRCLRFDVCGIKY